MSDFEGLTELYTLRVGDKVRYQGQWHRIAEIRFLSQETVWHKMEDGTEFLGEALARRRVRQPVEPMAVEEKLTEKVN